MYFLYLSLISIMNVDEKSLENDKVIMMYNNKDLAIYEVDGETLKPYVMF